jgi:glyoxylate/hydroxypyruvate reductase A
LRSPAFVFARSFALSPVNLLLHIGTRDADTWRAAFAHALPEAQVTCWPDVRGQVDYAAVWKPPPEFFIRQPAIKAIFNLGAGVDSLLRVATLPPDVPIVRLEDAGMAIQMAEYVALAVLAAYRGERTYARQQREERWEPHARIDKQDFAIGLLGVGVLGQAVAAALAPFGFAVNGWCRSAKTLPGIRVFAGADALAEFLRQSRVLVCLLPSTNDTRNLLDRTRLLQLPRGAHLINIARGDIVVDADLVSVLDEGHLSGATLDVFREEPLPAGHPFWHHPAIVVTPHVAALTLVDDSVAQIAAKIRRFEQGLAVSGVIDRRLGY